MNDPRTYGFGERLEMSHGQVSGASVESILLANIPGAVSVHPAHESNDRKGTDWWVEMRSGAHVSVDAKVRAEDWLSRGKDDLALETWSVIEARKIGWTRDASKRADYILWLWKDTGRWCLVPFQMLCGVFARQWEGWIKDYQTSRQHTPDHGGYHSECVFVPRRVLWAEIYKQFGGTP